MTSVFILWNNESIDLSEIFSAHPTREAAEKAQAEASHYFCDIVEVPFNDVQKQCDCKNFEFCNWCNPERYYSSYRNE